MSDSLQGGISADLIERISKVHTSALGHAGRIIVENPSTEKAIANLKDWIWQLVESGIFKQTDKPRNMKVRVTWFEPEVMQSALSEPMVVKACAEDIAAAERTLRAFECCASNADHHQDLCNCASYDSLADHLAAVRRNYLAVNR